MLPDKARRLIDECRPPDELDIQAMPQRPAAPYSTQIGQRVKKGPIYVQQDRTPAITNRPPHG